MRSLLILAVYLSFLGLGAWAPFVLGLGYIWVDLFQPQRVAWSLVTAVPVSAIMGAAAVGAYVLLDRRHPPRMVAGIWLLLAWAGWVTLTTTWAELQGPAWEKWNWAVKTIVFAAFMPFLFRSRIQIEAMLLVVALSFAAMVVPFGAKTLISGGGYGADLGLVGGNSGLAESSTLAALSVALLPLVGFLARHSLILPPAWWTHVGWAGLALACVATALGSFARTGLVVLAVLGAMLWWRSRRKLATALAVGAAGFLGLAFADEQWSARMSTIAEYGSEVSALRRIAVWRWTMDYVEDNPLGGGFGIYRVNSFEIPVEVTGEILEIKGVAFHSAYFEVLGEHGWVGLAIYALLLASTFRSLRRVARAANGEPKLAWAGSLARALGMSAILAMVGGAFIGIAFQPFLYYLVAASISLRLYCERRPRQGRKETGLASGDISPGARPS